MVLKIQTPVVTSYARHVSVLRWQAQIDREKSSISREDYRLNPALFLVVKYLNA